MQKPVQQGCPSQTTQEAQCLDDESVRSRARLLRDRKNFDGAAQVLQQLIQRQPENAEAMNELGAVLLCAGRFEESLNWFRRALGIYPLVSAKTNIGLALRHLNRLDEAISSFRQVVESTPDDAIACFMRPGAFSIGALGTLARRPKFISTPYTQSSAANPSANLRPWQLSGKP
jgi:tetratricopeptide (TPR) repeat protein